MESCIMSSFKPSSCRHTRSYRALRIERLEHRALLAVVPVAPPTASLVITLHAANAVTDVWSFEGTVTGTGISVAGLTVDFGGVLASYHLTATVQGNGTYDCSELLRNLAAGTATAQTHDAAGHASNVAMTCILGQNGGCGGHAAPSVCVSIFGHGSGLGGGLGATIATVAGASRYAGDGGAATAAALDSPQGVAVDGLGNIFIADTYNNVVREVNACTGAITTVVGNGICDYEGDGGAATAAELDGPAGIAVDAAGDILIADSMNNVVREVDHATGLITTVAGNGTCGYGGDGSAATSAQLDDPTGVAVEADGDVVIADSGNNVIREVDPSTGVITTVAGNGTCDYGGDGSAATSAQLDDPTAVAVDPTGNILIADTGNNVIREVDLSTGLIETVAGNGTQGYSGNGAAATTAELSGPTSVAVDANGGIVIADSGNNVIRKVDLSTGLIETVAGNGTQGYSGNGGAATSAELSDPTGVAMDAAGNLLVADSMDNAVREVDPNTGLIDTVAGNGSGNYSGDGGAATSATLNYALGVAADTAGDLFIADTANNVIREVNASTGAIITIAGNGTCGYGGDGSAATSAQLNAPTGIAVDDAGDIFIADTGNNVIREIDLATGVITTVAGNGAWDYSGDGSAATGAQLNAPTGVAVDAGDIFIADTGNNVIREVDLATGLIETVAGNGIGGYSGDGSAAITAQLNDPTGLALDAAGDLLVADSGNNVVREVDHATGLIETVAGDGSCGYGGDGSAAASAQLNDPTGVAVDVAQDLFIADSGNNVIREVDHATGAIVTVAGNGAAGCSGEGAAAAGAQLNSPDGIATDIAGDLFIADSGNDVIRKVTPPLYWDPLQTGTEIAGGSGTWTSAGNTKCWYDPFLGADAAWSDGSNAVFAGTAATVTVSGTVSPTSVTFDASDYVLTGAEPSDGLVLPAGGVSIDVDAGLATLGCRIAGSQTLIVTGSGTLVLDGADANSGGTDLEGGTLQLGAGATLGSGGLSVDAGALDLDGQSITVGLLRSNTDLGLITNSSTTTSTLTVDQDGNAGYFGDIRDGKGAVRLVLAGNGILVAEGDSAFSGGTTISAGTFVATSADSLPEGTALTIGAGGTMIYDPTMVCAPPDGGQTSVQGVPDRTAHPR